MTGLNPVDYSTTSHAIGNGLGANPLANSSDESANDVLLLDYILQRINDFVKWDIIRCYYDNESNVYSADNLAKLTGRDLSVIHAALSALTDTGLLTRAKLGTLSGYTITTDQPMETLVSSFLKACEDSGFRMRAVQRLIRMKH